MQSLYRTYRPKNFGEVVGQKHVTQILSNQIKNGRVSHAYLFCGTRGTGKTSVAKIFARALTKDLDIFEIDAASNNSVQDVREIIEKVKFPPVVGEKKVYIIDEVHMFSQSAFNAFLKTLEEPPVHAIFVLCTTEPHKLLPTVQSRCLRLDFRAISGAEIEKHLRKILDKEGVQATDAAVAMLADSGCGSVRDALSFTETVVSYCGSAEVTEAAVAEVLGTVGRDTLAKLFAAIKNGDTKAVTMTTNEIFKKGINSGALVKNFLDLVKAELLTNPAVVPIFMTFSELELSIKNAADAKSHFETACLLSACKKEAL